MTPSSVDTCRELVSKLTQPSDAALSAPLDLSDFPPLPPAAHPDRLKQYGLPQTTDADSRTHTDSRGTQNASPSAAALQPPGEREQPQTRIPVFTDTRLQIDSFPGATCSHITALLRKLRMQPQVERVILSVGLNKQFMQLIAAANTVFPMASIHVPLIHYSDKLPINQKDLIKDLIKLEINLTTSAEWRGPTLPLTPATRYTGPRTPWT